MKGNPNDFTPVLISGLPGKMATLVTQALLDDDRYIVVPYTLVGSETTTKHIGIELATGEMTFLRTIRPQGRARKLRSILEKHPDLIIVDYSVPSAVNGNARLFCKLGIPFVMGTTGGNREALKRTVELSDIPAVISPNMSPAIVLFMAMIEYGAKTFPGALKDFSIEIFESHQSTKKDVSGTAKAVGELFKKLGVDYRDEDSIDPIRTEEEQLALGVPEKYLGGHGWHTYKLFSPDRSVELGFLHDVNGRQTYVDGTLACIPFLAQKAREIANSPRIGRKGVCYSVINVLKNPAT